MKRKAFIILSILITVSLKSIGQKLEENKKDEFTNQTIKRTSWENLSVTLNTTARYRISRINNDAIFDLKLMIDKVFFIDQDAPLMFKLANGEVVTLKNFEYTITCRGCGATGSAGSAAEGIQVTYPMSSDQVEKLKANKIIKVRISTNLGYLEEDIKDKNAEKIIKAVGLI